MATAAVNWGDPRLPERFWDKVLPEPNTGCWLWTSGDDSKYPNTNLFGARTSVRRAAYLNLIGDVPNRVLRAGCGTDLCVNPQHVTLARKTDYARIAQVASWYANNKHRRRAYTLKHKYGISPDDYERMLRVQDDRCAICRNKFDHSGSRNKPRAPAVDHCHATDTVRSLLCKSCNSGIGYFSESPAALRAAADYLVKHGKGQP